jgi:hypothetical protein
MNEGSEVIALHKKDNKKDNSPGKLLKENIFSVSRN